MMMKMKMIEDCIKALVKTNMKIFLFLFLNNRLIRYIIDILIY